MVLNLHLTRIFFTVVEQGGFSRAADTLFISQSATSKAVRELESQLDLALIERGGPRSRGVRLTDAGRALHEHARGIFALERAAVEELNARAGVLLGRLTIGASTTITSYWLPPYIALFSRRYPDVEVRIVVGNTQYIAQGLAEFRLDLALVEGGVSDDRLLAEHWRDEELVLVAARDFAPDGAAVDRHRLNQQQWLVREVGSGTREVAQRLLLAYGIELDGAIEIGSNEGIARAVAHGLGIAMLPRVVVQDLLELGRLQLLSLPTPLDRPLYTLTRAGGALSPAAQAFKDLLVSETTTG